MKVLLIGQLPKEYGGTYTTGIAKVVYELSKCKDDRFVYYMYATNCKQAVADKLSTYPNQYTGYKYHIAKIVYNILRHPLRTIQEWKAYRKSGDNPLRFELYKANFQRVIKKIQPDVIHMNGNGLAPLAFADVNPHIPIVLTCHGVFGRFVDPNSLPKLYADYLTGLTEETLEEIHKYYCVTNDDIIRIIPNGVNTTKFYYSEDERNKIRKEYGVTDNTLVFITVASVQERKGQLSFVKLLEQLNIDYQYWIVGQGPQSEEIKEYCLERGLESKVKTLGYRNSDELYKYYSAADVYAHASTMEGQALCEIEAFSTGLPCIVNNLIKGTIAKEEKENGNYLYYDSIYTNLKQIEKWLRQLDIGERKSRSNMDWSKVAEMYGDFYKEILMRQ